MQSISKTQPMSNITKGYLIALFATSIWSTAAIFIRILSVNFEVPSMVVAFWRDFLVFLLLFNGLLIFKSQHILVRRNQFRFLLIYGFILSLFNGIWTLSVVLNGAAIATVLVYCSAAFTALWGWRFMGEKLDFLKIMAVVLSLIGCVFVSGAYDYTNLQTNPIGIATGLISGVAFAAYSLLGKISSQRGNNPWTTMTSIFGVAAFFLFLYLLVYCIISGITFFPQLFWLGTSFPGWGVMLALAVIPGVGGYGFYLVSMTYLPASVANLIATLEPAITAMMAYLFLGERMTSVQVFGSVLIISGVVLLRVSELRNNEN